MPGGPGLDGHRVGSQAGDRAHPAARRGNRPDHHGGQRQPPGGLPSPGRPGRQGPPLRHHRDPARTGPGAAPWGLAVLLRGQSRPGGRQGRPARLRPAWTPGAGDLGGQGGALESKDDGAALKPRAAGIRAVARVLFPETGSPLQSYAATHHLILPLELDEGSETEVAESDDEETVPAGRGASGPALPGVAAEPDGPTSRSAARPKAGTRSHRYRSCWTDPRMLRSCRGAGMRPVILKARVAWQGQRCGTWRN